MAVASIRTLSELFLVHSANTPDEDPSQRDRVENKTNKMLTLMVPVFYWGRQTVDKAKLS